MFAIFENRNKSLASLIKMSDYLGHSLRENVILFDVDASKNTVIYITESKKVISASYLYEKTELKLSDVEVQDSSLFEDANAFDDHVRDKVGTFVRSIYESDYQDANVTFDDVLDLWKNQVKYGSMLERMETKISKFNKTHKIIEEDSIQQVIELLPQIVEHLKESKDDILNIPEIKNGVRLSNVVSEAFDIPHMSYDLLAEAGSFELPSRVNESVYEIICNQEMIKQELIESKRAFETVWATSDKVKNLAQNIFESDEENTIEALAEAFEEVPFIALASKKQLNNVITNVLEMYEVAATKNEITEFVSRIFEMKKPLKSELITMINEKYGINAQNLNEVPSFKSLLNTQVVIFESLSQICPKKSVIRSVLHEASITLKSKNGVESVDINTLLMALFEEAEFLDDMELNTGQGYEKVGNLLEDESVKYIVKAIKKDKVEEADTKEAPSTKDSTISGEEEEENPKTGEDDQHPVVQGDDEASLMGMPDVLTKEDFIKNRGDMEEVLAELIDGMEEEDDDEEDSVTEAEEKNDEDLAKSLAKDKKKADKKKKKEDDGEPEDEMYGESVEEEDKNVEDN